MTEPLNRKSAPRIIRFFDLCFKQGVMDAYNFADDYGARDFVNQHREAWDFGVLGEPDDFDWEMWRFTLYRWGRQRGGFVKFAENYIYRIVKKNYLWYFLPFCMWFYLMGIEEWLEYPNPSGMELFKNEPKVHWKKVPANLRKMTTNDFISYMQECVYEYRRTPEEGRTMNARTMDAYCQAMHDLTRRYETGKRFRIKDLKEADS